MMDEDNAVSLSMQNLRAANLWNANFQKFTMLKLVLRLLTIITEEHEKVGEASHDELMHHKGSGIIESSPKKMKEDTSDHQDRIVSPQQQGGSDSKRGTTLITKTAAPIKGGKTEDTQPSSIISQQPFQHFKSDGLGYLQQQIANNVQRLIEEFPSIQTKDLYIKVKSPVISRELDQLISVISSVSKLHVAEIVAEALHSVETRSSGALDHTSRGSKGTAPAPVQIEPKDVYEALQRREYGGPII